MGRPASPIIDSFNGGELSPRLYGKTQYEKYAIGCRRLQNFLPSIQGAAIRRGGTRFVAEVKDSTRRTWLRRFVFNVNQPYMLEFGHLYVRFYANREVVESSPGVPLEVVTPYTESDLLTEFGTLSLRFAQTGDVLYIVHPDYAPRKLTRTGPAAFNLQTATFTGGPFKDTRPDKETTTVYASADTGNITLHASTGIFKPEDVGNLFYLEQQVISTLQQWAPDNDFTNGQMVRSGPITYKHIADGNHSGTIAPVHLRGQRQDGTPGTLWEYHDPGYGRARITGYTNSSQVSATVIDTIPADAVGSGNASNIWAKAAWSTEEGWPSNVAFFRERLCFARDQKIWLSTSQDFEDFTSKDRAGNVTADRAISVMVASDEANAIQWMAASDFALLCGTAGDEFAVSEISTASALSQSNIQGKFQTGYGSRPVQPVKVGNGVLFVQKSGRKVRDVQYNFYYNRYDAPDATAAAEHITQSGIVDMTFQQETDSIVWAVREDGLLVGYTLQREEKVSGWHRQPIGGYADALRETGAMVEAADCIPTPGLMYDDLWMIVRRYIGGRSVRYVEFMERYHEEGNDPYRDFYVDCGLSLNGASVGSLSIGPGRATIGMANVVFTTAASYFVSGDVGKEVQGRYPLPDENGDIQWHSAKALITQFDHAQQVKATIIKPFPTTASFPEGTWGKSVTRVTGLNHLRGETVQILANGAVQPARIVDGGGGVDLDTPASFVHVGLGCPAQLVPMWVETGQGTDQGKMKRFDEIKIRMLDTLGLNYGPDLDHLVPVNFRDPTMLMDEPPPLFSGDKVQLSWPTGHSREGQIMLVCPDPLPATIVSIMPQMKVSAS